jgi:endonuclease YncB( thermonuclease family)
LARRAGRRANRALTAAGRGREIHRTRPRSDIMTKPLQSRYEQLAGHFGFGAVDGGFGNAYQQVHDGDTIYVRTVGNLGLRFLGIDTPELSFTPAGARFPVETDAPSWQEFLADSFAEKFGLKGFDAALKTHLQGRLGKGCAENHHRHAVAARDALRAEVDADMRAQHRDKDTFVFHVRFAREAIDAYGRFLGYVNRRDAGKDRPLTYNERLLQAGLALPYFIWPNVNPFRKQSSLLDAVPKPDRIVETAARERTLREARQWVKQVRTGKRGVFAADDPLRLAPFELRYLGKGAPPRRWVADLAHETGELKHPQRYFEIADAEDRLFVPEEYVALWEQAGWRRQIV